MLQSRGVTLVLAIAVGVVFVAGLVIDGAAGALLLLLVAVGLGLLTRAVWERLPARARVLRVAVVVAVVAVAVAKLAG